MLSMYLNQTVSMPHSHAKKFTNPICTAAFPAALYRAFMPSQLEC